jgi:hypothetical protein
MSEKLKKPFFEREISCAHCGKPNRVILRKHVITEAVKGETEIEVEVEKVMKQATLQ